MSVTVMKDVGSRLQSARVGLLAAAVSFYFLVALLPILVLASGVVGLVSRRNRTVTTTIIDQLGVSGQAATAITDSIRHAEGVHTSSSFIGILGLLWAASAATGALRRAVDAVWGEPDVGWTARLRAQPWALVAAILLAGSMSSTALATWLGRGILPSVGAAVLGAVFTAALAVWFLEHLGSHPTSRHAVATSALLLTCGLEATKYASAILLPHLISRESLLYGSLGSALGLLAVVLITSWLLLLTTALCAELSTRAHVSDATGSDRMRSSPKAMSW